jgi:predicted Zn finger-like uncharacterized protein
MYTECPACQTVFRVTAITLRTAHGQARCGICNTTFDALFGLTDELPLGYELPVETLGEMTSQPAMTMNTAKMFEDAGFLPEDLDDLEALEDVTLLHIPRSQREMLAEDQPLVVQAIAEEAAREQRRWQSPRPPADLPVDDDPTGTWSPLVVSSALAIESGETDIDAPAANPHPAAADQTLAGGSSPPAPTTLDGTPIDAAIDSTDPIDVWMDTHTHRRRPSWRWSIACTLLLLGLFAQGIHHWRDRLAQHPTLGTPVQRLYIWLGAPLEPPVDVLAYDLRDVSVGAALQPGVLRVSATIVNHARGPQPRPLLQVTLEDRFGAPLGRRLFQPDDYFSAGTGRMRPNSQINALLDLADPGSEAVGYKLDLCLQRDTGLDCAAERRAAPPP